jgi:hypothetical protein
LASSRSAVERYSLLNIHAIKNANCGGTRRLTVPEPASGRAQGGPPVPAAVERKQLILKDNYGRSSVPPDTTKVLLSNQMICDYILFCRMLEQ